MATNPRFVLADIAEVLGVAESEARRAVERLVADITRLKSELAAVRKEIAAHG